jgi:tripartite-type tricarboxylate transporter receptor subunit TctC
VEVDKLPHLNALFRRARATSANIARWISLCLFLVFLFAWNADLHAQANFYQGKAIRVIVGSSPGGGYDLWARLMAQYLGKYIPGNPEAIVQNMPGAGGVVAANYIYAVAHPDGLTLGAFNPALYFDQLVGRPEVKFDWSKFTWIGSPEQNDVLHYIRADTPYKTIDDAQCQRAAALRQHGHRNHWSLHPAFA